jgi:gamma-glutamyl hercynylcysteine S-oxide synthase
MLRSLCEATLAEHGDRVLYVRRDSSPVTLAQGYIPLLTRYTVEDKEAKGLRSLVAAPAKQKAVHFSALERVGQEPRLLLLGGPGSGKTTFAIHLALHLAGEFLGRADFNVTRLCHIVPRNDDGDVLPEAWPAEPVVPLYLPVDRWSPAEARSLLDSDAWQAGREHLLLIVDDVDKLGDRGPEFLGDLVAFADRYPRVRLLVCGESRRCKDWACPPGLVKETLLPLLRAQRGDAGEVFASPAMFALSRGLDDVTGVRFAHEVVDRWIAAARTSFAKDQRFFQIHLLARDLAALSAAEIAARFAADPQGLIEPLTIAAQRWAATGRSVAPLVHALVESGPAGAVAGAGLMADAPSSRVVDALVATVEHGRLPLSWRIDAGKYLASWGDTRDLEALVDVPAGVFEMGSRAHPNSDPPHQIHLPAYRIGKFPVTNAIYAKFVAATGRPWSSSEGRRPERANCPAVDLTWRDACAYCAWLTPVWRTTGRIAPHETVRLPTEPEWEKAARGNRPARGEEIVYPWPGAWQADRQNAEDAGLNDTCTVGLFPDGVSPYGCLDMSGQVWEWTSTLWGDDMAAPSFRYPYRDDGREDLDAAPSIRRVLRGGCFSSARFKACCTYRGSLEPDAFWRGNGFRVVVA